MINRIVLFLTKFIVYSACTWKGGKSNKAIISCHNNLSCTPHSCTVYTGHSIDLTPDFWGMEVKARLTMLSFRLIYH